MYKGQLRSAQGAVSVNPVKSSLMESSQTNGDLVACFFLHLQADGPIQWLFEVFTTIVLGDANEALPTKFLLELHGQLGPHHIQRNVAVRDGSKPRSAPVVAVLQVEAIVQEICLQSLKRSFYHLPFVLGLLECGEREVPAGLEEVLLGFVKAMIDLPDRVYMLRNNGVSWIRMFLIHVIDNVNGA